FFDGLFSHKFFLLRAPPSKLLLEDLINEKRSKKARSLTSSLPRPTMFSKLSFRAEGQENSSFVWADNARSLPGARDDNLVHCITAPRGKKKRDGIFVLSNRNGAISASPASAGQALLEAPRRRGSRRAL